MKECDNSKVHTSSNFILSISPLIMFDTLLLRPSLRYTSLHFATLHPTTLHYTSLNYTSLHFTQLHFTTLHSTTFHHTTQLHYTTLRYTSPNYTSLHFATLHPTTLHHTSLNYISAHFTQLYFTTLHPTTLHYTCLGKRETDCSSKACCIMSVIFSQNAVYFTVLSFSRSNSTFYMNGSPKLNTRLCGVKEKTILHGVSLLSAADTGTCRRTWHE